MLTLWHNPRCSKSRETLALLQAHGQAPALRLYLDAPPTLAELQDAVRRPGQPARALVRMSEADFRALNLPADADDATLLKALAANPHLIERPLLLAGDRAVIGRPPEAVLTLL